MKSGLLAARGIAAALLALCGAGAVSGQTTTTVTDSQTPAAAEAGIPSQSYALSNIDTVDPYTGSVNIHIPLYKVGGRGEAGYTVTLLLEQKWQMATHTDATGNYYFYPEPGNIDDSINYWLPSIVKYTPGVMISRESTDVSQGTWQCTGSGTPGGGYIYFNGQMLTRLTFIDETGTEHELVDTQTNGQPINPYPAPYQMPTCQVDPINGGTDRGRTFRSTDGTSLVFTADSDVRDKVALPNKNTQLIRVMMSGWLRFADGHEFRFDNGQVSSIEDRNGNQVTIRGGTVTDAVGRTITIAPATNWTSGTPADTITYARAGVQRQIQVRYAPLGSALAAGQALATYKQLFETPNASSTTQYNPWVAQAVVLADGSQYTFAYNSYGEVAWMKLPTGGVVTYQYPAAASCQADCNILQLENVQGTPVGVVLRPLQQRNEYANGGAVTRQTSYAYAATSQGSTLATVTEEDGSGNVLGQAQHTMWGDVWAPDVSGVPESWYSQGGMNGKELETVTLSGSGQVLRQETENWAERGCAGSNWPQTGGGAEPCWWVSLGWAMDHDPQLASVTRTESGWEKESSYAYDQNNNRTDDYEYDWGSGGVGSLLKHTATSYVTGASYSSVNLVDLPSEVKVYDGAGHLQGDTQYGYDGTSLTGDANIVQHDNTNYGGAGARGNVTTVARCATPGSCGWLTTTYYYDVAGNTVQEVDANGHATSYGYGDSYSDGVNRNTYAHVTAKTNGLGQIARWQWDYSTGKVATATDLNGVNTVYSYNDALDRLTQARRAAGLSSFETQTNVTYTSPTDVNVYHDQSAAGDKLLRMETLYDGFGREVETNEYESSTSYIATTKTYDALGRVAAAQNPSRIAQNDGLNYTTTYQYDALGRTTSITTADGAVAATSYAGIYRTETDQAGHARVSQTDGLGRMTAVWEDPGSSPHLNYETSYSYDALGDLTSVTQGAESRTFTYDGLGRLTKSVQPESGTTETGETRFGFEICRAKDLRGRAIDLYVRVTSEKRQLIDISLSDLEHKLDPNFFVRFIC